MKKYSLFLLLFALITNIAVAQISPVKLKCEYLDNPRVIDIQNPRLSWVNIAQESDRGQLQTAWEIRVAGSKEKLLNNQADLWASGKVISNQSVNIHYGGKPLISRQDCWWQVRTWDKDGKVSAWSEPAFWSMGLLKPEEWKAKWIGAPWQGEEALPKPSSRRPGDTLVKDQMPPPAPLLRKSFNINKQVSGLF
jgi:alpha-L-rhamnosidase